MASTGIILLVVCALKRSISIASLLQSMILPYLQHIKSERTEKTKRKEVDLIKLNTLMIGWVSGARE
jgi:hypothetical protein